MEGWHRNDQKSAKMQFWGACGGGLVPKRCQKSAKRGSWDARGDDLGVQGTPLGAKGAPRRQKSVKSHLREEDPVVLRRPGGAFGGLNESKK